MFYRKAAALMLCLTMFFYGCSNEPEKTVEPKAAESVQTYSSSLGDPALEEAPKQADPKTAIDIISDHINVKGVEFADDTVMEEKFFFDLDDIDEYYVLYSSGRYGVADVYIVKPKTDKMPSVRETLEQVKINRVNEFEDYNVYDSLRIANDAEIFEQQEFLIMLMVPDEEFARKTINQFIPN